MFTRGSTVTAALIASVMTSTVGARFGAWTPLTLHAGRQTGQRSAIVFASTRHSPAAANPLLASEIYLMDGDGGNPHRLTENTDFDGFPSLSRDGRIVFDSHRARTAAEPLNTSDLFVMNTDGTAQTRLTPGSSATWSPDGKMITFHASASGTGKPIKTDPGAATGDSDIFVMNVNDFLKKGSRPTNLTNSPSAIDDDAAWSPTGGKIVFTSHAVSDEDPQNSVTAEIYVINADGKGKALRLTDNAEEERAPSWSSDGTRILFMCRKGAPAQGGTLPTFELCVMRADGTDLKRLTNNAVPELSPSWSPDGRQIVFHRPIGGRGQFQLFVIDADGTGERQLTFPPGLNGFANWGAILHGR